MKKTLLLLLLLVCGAAQAQDRGMKVPTQDVRVALVIGNGAYAESPLKNPPNDATAMAAELRACGFDVTLLTNASLRQMQDAAVVFGQKIRGNQGVGLFYFAGHGMQVAGENYLMPVGAKISVEGDVQYEAMNVGRLLAQMEAAQNKLNIVVLDACRNNPYARSTRSAVQGLALPNAPVGSFIAFATQPNSVASDNSASSNGLYTQELLKALRTPGLELGQVFKQVRAGVVQQSGKAQTPQEYTSVIGDFYFRPGSIVAAAPAAVAAPKTTSPTPVSASSNGAEYIKLKQATANANYHAVFIAVQDYKDGKIPKLDNTIAYTKLLAKVLVDKYTFKEDNVTVLENPTRNEIENKLEALHAALGENDNLVVFYRGHGFYDEEMAQSYWLPADAEISKRSTWFSNSTLCDYFRFINTKHTLLISDAAFSSSFKTRDFKNAPAIEEWLYRLKSRNAMTSGDFKAVPDKSVFVETLIKALENNAEDFVTALGLFIGFRDEAINNSPKRLVPLYGEIGNTGDQGGQFIFVLKKH